MLRITEQLPIKELNSMSELHDKEIELVTELHTAAKEGQTELVLELLNKLIEYTREHFSTEESLMSEVEYPDTNLHKYEHSKQLLDLQSILSFYEMTNDTNSIYTYLEDSLTPWTIQHVENWDTPASEFIKEYC